tara:strand:+ start:727 stop:966 length:240 start_codon:yes stop_codon:yes gene_type:complete
MEYRRLSNREIYNNLILKDENAEFSNEAERFPEMKFDQVEDAAYALNINFDAEMAEMAIAKGADLTDTLWASQVEFCSC